MVVSSRDSRYSPMTLGWAKNVIIGGKRPFQETGYKWDRGHPPNYQERKGTPLVKTRDQMNQVGSTGKLIEF